MSQKIGFSCSHWFITPFKVQIQNWTLQTIFSSYTRLVHALVFPRTKISLMIMVWLWLNKSMSIKYLLNVQRIVCAWNIILYIKSKWCCQKQSSYVDVLFSSICRSMFIFSPLHNHYFYDYLWLFIVMRMRILF